MSEEVIYYGTITEVFEELDNINDKISKLLTEEQLKECKQNYRNDFIDYFYENDFYENYIIVEDRLFKILSINKNTYDDIFHARQNGENIEFIVKFYNGGCSFPEAISEAIDKIK